MATIVTLETGATAKGSPLTNAEVDNNFINLNNDKIERVVNVNSATPGLKITNSGTGVGLEVDDLYSQSYITSETVVRGRQGVQMGENTYPVYQTRIEFAAIVGEWRKIAAATLVPSPYSSCAFKIDIIDPEVNFGAGYSVHPKISTYYVALTRSATPTDINDPDMCTVTGPAGVVRAVKVAQGSYEIQVTNTAAWREYQITIQGYVAEASPHSIEYFTGVSAGSPGIAQYTATRGSGLSYFENVSAQTLISTNPTGIAPLQVSSTTKVTNLNVDYLDGMSAEQYVYGNPNNASNNGPGLTWASSHISQYKSGFWDQSGASWTPDTGWWWGITAAHTSNGPAYNFSGQIVFQNSSTTPKVYTRSIANGTPSAWAQVYTSNAPIADMVFSGIPRAPGGIAIGADADVYIYEDSANSFSIRTGPSTAYRYFTFNANGELIVNNGLLKALGGLQAFSETNDGTLSTVKFGRDTLQYISLHGGSSGNYLTSKSLSANQKNFVISVRDDTLQQSFVFGLNGSLTIPTGTGVSPFTIYSSTLVSSLNADLWDGAHRDSVEAGLRANVAINGGGTISVSSSGEIKWSSRFIVITQGRGAHFSTAGYYDINCPAAGTVITGVGGATNVTVTAGGIPLGAWQALYYIMDVNSSQITAAANFRIASYTSALYIPSNWVLICTKNGDNDRYYFPNGYKLKANQLVDTVYFDARYADDANKLDGLDSTEFIRDFGTTPQASILTIPATSGKYRWNDGSNGRPADTQVNEYGTLLHLNYDNDLATQLAHDIYADNLYFRTLTTSTGTGTAWKRVLNTTDLGVNIPVGTSSNSWTSNNTFSGGLNLFRNDSGSYINSTIQVNNLQVHQMNATGDALMTFHISGVQAVHFGLDRSTYDLAVGGWSWGAVKRRIYHEGNRSKLLINTGNNVDAAFDFGAGNYMGFNAYYENAAWRAKASQNGWFVFRNGDNGTGFQLFVEDGAVTAGAAVSTYNTYAWRDGSFYSGTNKYLHAAETLTMNGGAIIDGNGGGSWISQKTATNVLIQETNTNVAGNTFRAFIRSTNLTKTMALGRISDLRFGMWGWNNTDTVDTDPTYGFWLDVSDGTFYTKGNLIPGYILHMLDNRQFRLGSGSNYSQLYHSGTGIEWDFNTSAYFDWGTNNTAISFRNALDSHATPLKINFTTGANYVEIPRLYKHWISDEFIQIGHYNTGNRNAYIDFVADDTHADYGLRILRSNTGSNAISQIVHKGTGGFYHITADAAAHFFQTKSLDRFILWANGSAHLQNDVSDTEVWHGIAFRNNKASVSVVGQNFIDFQNESGINKNSIHSYLLTDGSSYFSLRGTVAGISRTVDNRTELISFSSTGHTSGYGHYAPSFMSSNANGFVLRTVASSNSGYGAILRNDNAGFYILGTNNNDSTGSFNGYRPFTFTFANGNVGINNTASASGVTKETYINAAGAAGSNANFLIGEHGVNSLVYIRSGASVGIEFQVGGAIGNHWIGASGGNPIYNFDTNDHFLYTRATNQLTLTIGSAVWFANGSGMSSSSLGVMQTTGAGAGVSLYNNHYETTNGIPSYGIAFAQTSNFGTHGAVTGTWATYFTMNNSTGRGWIFRDASTLVNVASISNTGNMTLNGNLSAASKSFLIDHPTKPNHKLRYGSLESPYHGVRLTGEGETGADGAVVIELPEYIHALCQAEGASVQLTVINNFSAIRVAHLSVDDDCFAVESQLPNTKFYWSFTAIRKDVEPMIVEEACQY